ncbi:MAG TPA: GNAT family N-acetyltransferase [Gaiellaceae bacterium]|jgi:ribosomal protein S18 acetylase RimI-like enzyme|nr:GNAT family N-acetyltransferase [Gaiellaceae bacterium]
MSDDLRQAFDFLTRADMAWSRSEPARFGTAVFDDRVPKRYDSNYLLVETLPRDATAEELAADAAGHGRRMIFFRAEPAEAVVSGFRALGWRLDRHVFMAQRAPVTRSSPLEVVRELDADDLRGARRRLLADYPWATPELLDQLHEAKRLIAERVETRFFGVVADGEVVSYADLYLDPPVAQIEDVGTLEGHRGKGYASAVVLRAAAEARRRGADLVFLVADAEDWPQHLYRRLGFEPIAHYVKLIAPES